MSKIYDIKIYDRDWSNIAAGNGTLVATVPNSEAIEIQKGISEGDEIRFRVPRGDKAIDQIAIGRIVTIAHDGSVQSAGIVTSPLNPDESPYVGVSAIGHAELLNWTQTPWRFRLEQTSATAQIRELLQTYKFYRRNTITDFKNGNASNIATVQLSTGTLSGENNWILTLATTKNTAAGSAIYSVSGTFISDAINMQTPNDFNRLRYEVQLGNATDVAVQLRSTVMESGNPSTAGWTAWSASQKRAFETDREESGLFFSVATPFNFVQARFLYSTTDTLVSPVLNAFEVVGEYGSYLSAGSIILPTTYKEYTFSFDSHLKALQRIVDDNSAEWQVTSGFTLHVKKQLGSNVAGTVMFNAEEDSEIIRYEFDDDNLTNQIWTFSPAGEGLNQMISLSENAVSQASYGIRQAIFQGVGTTNATLQTQGNSRLTTTKDPLKNITIAYQKIPNPSFSVGDTVRLRIPNRSIDQNLRVTRIYQFERESGRFIQADLSKKTERFTEQLNGNLTQEESDIAKARTSPTAVQKSHYGIRTLKVYGEVGFGGNAPTGKPAAYTQTYAATSRTIPNQGGSDVSTTGATTVSPFGYETAGQANDVVSQINTNRDEIDFNRQLINQIIDDLQEKGLLK